MASEGPNNPTPDPKDQAPRPAPTSENVDLTGIDDDVLGVIAEVETQLADLKRVHAERAKAAADLDDRERRVIEREHELVFQFEQLKGEHAAITEARQKLAAERDQINQTGSELEARTAKLDEHEKSLREQHKALKAERDELEVESAALAEARSRFDADRASAEETAQRIASLEADLASARDELAQARQHAENIAHERDQAQAAAEARGGDLEARERELADARAALDAAAEKVDHAETVARDAVAQANAQIHEIRAHLDSRISEVETLKADLGARDAELTNERAARSAAEKQLKDESAKRTQRDAQVKDLTKKLDVAKEKIREFAEALKQQMESGIGPDPALAENLERERQHSQKLREQISELKLALKESANGGDPAIAEAFERERAAAETLRARITDLENTIASSAQGDAALAQALEQEKAINQELRRRLADLETASEAISPEVQAELDQARARVEQLERALKKLASSGNDVGSELRRTRLRRIRARLREQSRKVRRVSEVLHERHQQCEALLTKRAELALAHQAITQERAKIDKRKARAGAVWSLLGAVIVLALLAGLSWVAADLVSPGRYAATTTLAAERGDRGLTADELASWQTYHEELIADPRFLQTLAERMQRRGLGDLSTPAAISTLFDDNLTTLSPDDGVLTLEIRGEGATRTQRILDTVVVTLASTANKNRARRADGAQTIVRNEPTTLKDPLDNTRLVTAGSIFGGSMLFALLVGGIVWTRLAKAKSSYERDQQLETLLDEARWVDPREQNAA